MQWVYGYNHGSALVEVVNMSLGFSTDSPALQQAIQAIYTSGVIMVAAAGNRCVQFPSQDEGGGDCQGGPARACDPTQTAVKYPAAYPEVMAVVATDFYDDVTAYSLSGPQVAVAAMGGGAGPVKRPRLSPEPSRWPCSSNRGSPLRRCSVSCRQLP